MKYLKNNYLPFLVLIGALVIMGFNIYNLDFNDLSFSNKENSYSGIIAMFLLVIAMIVTILFDPKNNKK